MVEVVVGVADHHAWAILVTADAAGEMLDRRRIELLDEGLPKHPFHHDAQTLPLSEARELIERVRQSALRHARQAFDELAAVVGRHITGIALRECPQLPDDLGERIADYWSQNRADAVMYREALAESARERGWAVFWYSPKRVFDLASDVLTVDDADAHLGALRQSLGAPWQKDHRVAMAAAVVAAADVE